jgi:hypothetical protein
MNGRDAGVGKSGDTEGTAPAATHHDGCACHVTINIESDGNVIINNCPTSEGEHQAEEQKVDCFTPRGACMPIVPGAKHKQSRDYKLAALAKSIQVPSTLAAAAFHTSRRYLAGRPAATVSEESVYATLRKLPRSLLACTIDAVDRMKPADRARLIDGSIALDLDQPVGETELSRAFAAEIVRRVGESVFAAPEAGEQERPGQVRVYTPQGEDFFTQVRICSVNGIRTAAFIPAIPIGDRLPGEIQRDCALQIVDGEAQMVCVDRTANCPGESLGPVCARVIDIAPGEALTLEGVNYFSVDARVRLQNPDATTTREVDCHVWGDVDTPVTEVVGGATQLVNDCRVHDRIALRVPDDLPPGLWRLQVVVPNITGIAELGAELVSNFETINVVVPETARFTIAVENIGARKETSPAWFGSDEVGLRTFAAAFDRDFNLLALDPGGDEPNVLSRSVRGDFDTGTDLRWDRIVFEHSTPILGLALVVVGDEIDSEKFYSSEMTSRLALFGAVIAAEFAAAGTAFKIVGLTLATMSTGALIATGAAAAVLVAIAIAVAIWAPADPLIRDAMGFSINDLATLTNVSIPAPERRTFTSTEEIVVHVNTAIPPKKAPFQYHENREYVSDQEDSRYGLVYRFNRLA